MIFAEPVSDKPKYNNHGGQTMYVRTEDFYFDSLSIEDMYIEFQGIYEDFEDIEDERVYSVQKSWMNI